MLLVYSLLVTLGFLLMSPLFLLRREKYASGFKQRLGKYHKFDHDGRQVIWLHCVSVGETNAARPLVDQLLEAFPDHRLVISTTTKTGQELAQKIFAGKADAIFYFPFDWKFSVRKALANYRPSLVLLMETEIWPRFIREAKLSGAKLAIVNGRLSEKSFQRYSRVRSFIKTILTDIDLGSIQSETDAHRFISLGIDPNTVNVTGNLKFDHDLSLDEDSLTARFRDRFNLYGENRLIIAASTHDPEERWVLESLDGILGHQTRLVIAPRHPERFDDVQKLLNDSNRSCVRRTDQPSKNDLTADVILLDSIGELRAVYPLGDIVFVGGSLIPHGGQSILEPAAFGKAIITGPFTSNFDEVIKEFHQNDAILQTSKAPDDFQVSERLYEMFELLLEDEVRRRELGQNAASVMGSSNRGATERTVGFLKQLVDPKTGS